MTRRHVPPCAHKLQPYFRITAFFSFSVQAQIGHQRLQAPVLFLERPEPPRLIHVQTAVLGSPVIQRLVGDAQLSRQILRRTPSFELLDGVNHLFFGELGLPHPDSSLLSSLRSFSNYPW
jgi:hypothetical protein